MNCISRVGSDADSIDFVLCCVVTCFQMDHLICHTVKSHVKDFVLTCWPFFPLHTGPWRSLTKDSQRPRWQTCMLSPWRTASWLDSWNEKLDNPDSLAVLNCQCASKSVQKKVLHFKYYYSWIIDYLETHFFVLRTSCCHLRFPPWEGLRLPF